MAYLVGQLFQELDAPQPDRDLVTAACIEAEIDEAIDVAFFDSSMVAEILGVHADRLGGLLMEGVRRAKPMVAGWARAGTFFGGVGGIVSAEGPLCPPLSRPSVPPPERTPDTARGARGPTVATPEAGETCPAIRRSSRLLVAFTRNTLKRGANTHAALPPRRVYSRDRRGPAGKGQKAHP